MESGEGESREGKLLVLRPPQSFNCRCTVIVTSSNGENDLPDINTGDRSVGLSPSSTHTGLKPVRTGTGQHLVDTGDMVGVSTIPLLISHHSVQILGGEEEHTELSYGNHPFHRS